MKIKLIENRCESKKCYTLGKTYEIFDESDGRYFLYDDDNELRYIGKDLKGNYFDWEIVEL